MISADGISFTTSGVPNVGYTLSNPVTVSSTTSSLTLNASTGVTFDAAPAALTMSDASNLTVNGTTPSVTFTTTVLNGSLTITANTPVEAGIVSNGGSPAFSSLTMAGSSQLLLDNTANTAFVTGTVIHANAGTTVGVNVSGIDSLGLATLNVNGGTFSLGSDGHNGSAGDNFANPITLSASGTIIGQQLGAGAVAGSTINLTGGIATGSNAANVLTLNTANGYTLNVASAVTGSGTVNGAGTVNLNVANPSYTGALTVASGTTTDNALGALATAGSATVNGGNLTIAAAGETVNNLTVNSGGTANINASGVNLPSATAVNAGGTLRVAGALGTVTSINVAGGGTLNVATTGNLANATVNLGSATNLLQPATLAVVTGAGSLGSGPVSVNPSAELRLSGGTGASNYTGSTISVNNGLVHVTSGSAANLGTAVINVTPQVGGGINGLTGVLYAGLSNGAVLNASGNGGSNIVSMMQGAVVGGVSPSNSRILTAASTPHGDGIDFASDADIGTFFGNAAVGSNAIGNYSSIFFGHFTAPTTGSYNFAVTGVDDNAAIYVDTANGTNFAQIATANCCNFSTTQSQGTAGTESLMAGQTIAVVFAQQDGGGGSSFAAGFELAPAPSNNNNNTYTIVGPGLAAQAGLWSFDTVTGGGTIEVDANASLAAGGFVTATNVNLANGATLTLSAPSNNFTSSSTQLSVTGTTPTATLGFAGSNNHTVNVGTLSIATGGTLNLTNTGTGAGVLNLTGTGDPSNTGSLRVGSGTALGGTGSTSGSVTVLSGGAILGASNGSLRIGGTLTLSSGSSSTFTLNSAFVNNATALVAVNGALTVNATHSIAIGAGSTLAQGTYDLYSFGSNANSFTASSFSAPTTYGMFGLTLNVTGSQVDLTVSPLLVWSGVPGGGAGGGTGSPGVWDNNVSNNWVNSTGAATTFVNNASGAVFSDSYAVTGGNTNAAPANVVTIQTGGVQPTVVSFANHAVSYTLKDAEGNSGVGINDSTNGPTVVSLSGNAGGGATVTFTNPNSYSGATHIYNGSILIFSNDDQLGLGTGAGNIVLGEDGQGGTLRATGGTTISLAGENDLGPGRNITLGPSSSSGAGTIDAASTGTMVNVPGVISNNGGGAGSLIIASTGGGGTVNLTNNNTYTGATTVNGGTLLTNAGNSATGAIGTSTSIVVNNGGTISVGGDNSFVGSSPSATNTIQINAGGTITNTGSSTNHLDALVLNGGTLSVTGAANPTYGNWNFDFGVSTPGNGTTSTISGGNAGLTQAGGTMFNIGAGDTVNVSTVLADSAAGSTGLIKSGAGTLNLSAVNTYSSFTQVSGGTLRVTNPSGSGTGSGFVNVGNSVPGSGTLTGTGFIVPGSGNSVSIQNGGTIAGASGGTLTINGELNLNNGSTLTFNLTAPNPSATGLIAVSGSVTHGITTKPAITLANTSSLVSGGMYDVFSYLSDMSITTSSFTLPSTYGIYTLNWSTPGFDELLLTVSGGVAPMPQVAPNYYNGPPVPNTPSTVPTNFGTAVTWSVTSNNTYAGIGSSVSNPATPTGPGGGGPFLTDVSGNPLTAAILAGTNSGSAQTTGGTATVSMSWRSRTLYETDPQDGGTPSAPPLQYVGSYLISNVLNLSGMGQGSGEPNQTDPFVLQMNYNPTLLSNEAAQAKKGTVFLGWLNPTGGPGSTPQWQKALTGDFNSSGVNTGAAANGGDAAANYQGSFLAFVNSVVAAENSNNGNPFFGDSAFTSGTISSLTNAQLSDILGAYGVDTSNHDVWAVINHNSQFAVVPEPSTLLLAALGLAGMAGYRVRRRRNRPERAG